MSKSKALVVPQADPLARHILHLQRFHQATLIGLSQSVAGAILGGLELLAVQAELKKSHSDTFEGWLEKHQSEIGFSRPTAFRYAKLAKGMQKRMGGIEPLLSFAPSELNPEQQKRLLSAVHKSVDGETLSELYLDLGIVKKKHGHGLLKDHDKSKKGGDDATEATPELLIQDELFGRFDGVEQIVKAWHTPTKVGKGKPVPLWEHMTVAQKTDALRKLETSITQLTDMRNQVKEALRK